MHSTTLLSTLLATATLTLANSVSFRSQDSTSRTIIFTPSLPSAQKPEGSPPKDNLVVPGNAEVTIDFADGWEGMWFSVSEGVSLENVTPGMLGEVTFNGNGGRTFYDVSAIDGPGDHVGVKQLWPKTEEGKKSGCEVFPCNTVYYHPDDVQTQVTTDHDLICTLGG